MSNSTMPREERQYLQYLREVHFRNQDGLCYFCDVEMTSADVPNPKPLTTVTIEHLKGRASGGGSNYLNTAASCLGCNKKRSQQHQVREKTVPKIVLKKIVEYTYAYTTPSAPKVLVLMNSRLSRDEAMLEAKKSEGEPITLKSAELIES